MVNLLKVYIDTFGDINPQIASNMMKNHLKDNTAILIGKSIKKYPVHRDTERYNKYLEDTGRKIR